MRTFIVCLVAITAFCGSGKASLVMQEAPDFTATAVMSDNSFEDITLSSYRGKYVVLFFYPFDFTFICPTEIFAFDDALEEFQKKETVVIGVSTDSQYTHLAWRTTFVEEGGIGHIKYPLVSDITKNISRSYDFLYDNAHALRGTCIIDKTGVVRHMQINEPAVGRNVNEIMRLIDAIRYVDSNPQVCPANWEEGDEAIEETVDSLKDYVKKRK